MGTNYYWHEEPPCEHCGRSDEPKHIGKSSAGWVFALHVYPEEGINDLPDWILRFARSPHIVDEYKRHVTPGEMLAIIMIRGRPKEDHPQNFDWQANQAMKGPGGLIRSQSHKCYAHGDGTWDCFAGDFS